MPPDILITENLGGPPFEDLKARFGVRLEPDLWKSPAKIKELLPAFRALIVRNQTRVNSEPLAAGDRLEVIGRAGAGLDNIDLPAASGAGIVVVSTPDQNS